MKQTLILIAALLLAGPLAAQAPSADRLEAAVSLMEAMEMEEMMKETLEQTLAFQTRMLPPMGADARADSMAAATQEIARRYAARAMEWETLRPEVAGLYAEIFTVEELRQLETFYRSPLGRVLLEATPEMTVGMQEITARRMQAMMPEMMQEMMELVEEMTRGGGS